MSSTRNLEKELKIILENSPVGIVLTNMQNQFVYVNPSFREMLGYSEKEILSMNIVELTHPDSISKSKEAIKDVFSGKGPISIEKQYIHKNGSIVDAITSIAAVFDDDGNPLYQCTNIENITEKKKVRDKLIYQASHDGLTELINRREFEDRAKGLLNNAIQFKNEHAMLFIDLDQFKIVNDTHGHGAGDQMLRQLSDVIKFSLRKTDTLARLGGDEFGLLVENCSLESAYRIAESVWEIVQGYEFAWEGSTSKVGVSIGLVEINSEITDLAQLMSHADAACYSAKDAGRNRIHIYKSDDIELSQRHGEMQWVTRIHHALENDLFCLYAQRIVSLNDNTEKYYEFLIRLKDENGNLIVPGEFLPAAERYNLIEKIDRWVINAAFDLLKSNPSFLNDIKHISINLSGQSLTNNTFLASIIAKLLDSKIPGEKICFEITETAAIHNLTSAIKFITTLRDMGCTFALDDFGSGLSSFGYLKNLPVDYLKIDGMFVKDMVNDPIDRAMVKSINEIGQLMNMQTIAEYVENTEILEMLKDIGVDYAQGYGVSKPIDINELF
ncbi:MAG: EAL domain-containing protein [Methylophilaceae bacterium]